MKQNIETILRKYSSNKTKTKKQQIKEHGSVQADTNDDMT